ncbi:hypothetical protein [Streptomyces vinaceus]|uniref:hypothetical protein n=1 Tax=Streptomyces vinaceus TaxID=1960 RepID=UPI0036D1DF99
MSEQIEDGVRGGQGSGELAGPRRSRCRTRLHGRKVERAVPPDHHLAVTVPGRRLRCAARDRSIHGAVTTRPERAYDTTVSAITRSTVR